MLNVSLSEVLLVLLVAILAFKPRDLAAACANIGGWIWRLRQLLFSLQHDILVEHDSVKNILIENNKNLISTNESTQHE